MLQRSRRTLLSPAGLAVVALLATVAVPIAAARPVSAQPVGLHGRVLSGATPLAAYSVTLHATNGGGTAATLGTATTAADGSFTISYEAPADPRAVLYLLAQNTSPPNPGAVTLASVLGTAPIPADVVVNERTTVASGYALAQFAHGLNIAGASPGLQNAAGMVRNLVDLATGNVGSVLGSLPNGPASVNPFNSLANMVAACVATPAGCAALFTAATPPGGPAPPDSFQAIVEINHNPWQNVAALFALSIVPPAPYSPALSAPPDAWTLALRFVGDGASMSGPGNIAIDARGNLWVTNNYEFSLNPAQPVCGSKLLLEFTPTGQYVPGSPYRGGGLNGAGFGIDIDPYGDIWVGNFGFAAPAPGCPANLQPPHNSVSEFTPDGKAVSPDATPTSGGGFTQGGVAWPQGTISDLQGNIWIANCNGSTVTEYPGGNPNAAREIGNLGLTKPFGIVRNTRGDLFVTGVASNNVAILHPDGSPTPVSPVATGGIDKPLGIAADSRGNVWVANSGLVDVPCPDRNSVNSHGGSITLISPDGQPASPTAFTGGGLTIPWGIAADGNDNVWVANFGQKRLSEFCGSQTANCPPGTGTGQAISPSTGYGFDGLVRNTGVAIDPSGNVWLANNWKEAPPPANPGGYEMVAYVGLAGPVNRAAPRPRPAPAPLILRFTG